MASPAPDPYGLVVIGSGPAGTHAAVAYLEAGGPGRVCLLSADQDPPYQRPPLSKAVLSGQEDAHVVPILEGDSASVLERVDLRLETRAVALDLEHRRVSIDRDGRPTEVAYERLVVATGSDAATLPRVAAEAHVFALRSLVDARGLVRALDGATSVVVVGSGFIGCEAAASLRSRGLHTQLVTSEAVPQAARLGGEVGSRIAGWLTDSGVVLHTGVEVADVAAPGTVHLDDGSSVAGDVVLVAVGVDQSRAFLERSGLVVEGGRLVVDAQLRTSDAHVWAAGDTVLAHHAVAGRALSVEHWGDAMTMGTLAGRNAAAAAGGDSAAETWSDAPGFWSEIGSHTLKYSAWGDGHDAVHVVDHGRGAFTAWYGDEAGELVGVLSHGRDEDYERGGELLARRASLEEALSGGLGS